jgi:hypothetical protein
MHTKQNASFTTLNATKPRQFVRWFAVVLIGPIYIGEQMVSGLDTLDKLKAIMAANYSRFIALQNHFAAA